MTPVTPVSPIRSAGVSSAAPSRPPSRPASGAVPLIIGWCVAHLIPVVWIASVGTSTGDVRYYFRGLAGLQDGAMYEYPEVGTWPARVVELVTRDEDAFVVGFIALSALVSAVFTWWLWHAGRKSGRRSGIQAAWFWVLFAGLSGPIFLTRLDIFPGLLVAGFAALLFAGTRWSQLASVLLAVATMMKLWPGVLGAALVGGIRRASTWVRTLWFFGSLAALCALVLAVGGVDRLLSPLTYQGDRGLQIESVAATPWMLAAALHSGGSGDSGGSPWSIGYAESKSYEIAGPGVAPTLTVATVLTALVILLAVGWAVARLRRDDWTPVRAMTFAMTLVMLIIVTNKVFSPQYLAWITPVAAVAVLYTGSRISRVIAVEILVATLLTALVYPVFYNSLLVSPPTVVGALILAARNIVVVVLAVTCARWAFSSPDATARETAPAASGRAAG